MARLRDRAHAGERLAPLVAPLLAGGDAIVLGIPRGGAIVARALADALALPLDLVVVRKLGVPGHEEYGFGAIGEDGVTVLDRETVASIGLSADAIEAVAARERAELERRVAAYAGGRRPQPGLNVSMARLKTWQSAPWPCKDWPETRPAEPSPEKE